MSAIRRRAFLVRTIILLLLFVAAGVWHVFDVHALNIRSFSDTLSDSTPGDFSNHTISFIIEEDIPPSGYIEFVPPPNFTIATSIPTTTATMTFSARNVELYVNTVLRSASSSGSSTTDEILITPGTPGSIRYTFNPTTGISNGDRLDLLIGDHTSQSFNGAVYVSTSTGTTTDPDDIGIQNASTTGTHGFVLDVVGGASQVYGNFKIALVDEVGVGPIDTFETVPPVRFNGAPTGDVGGTTLSVELSVETDEFAICKYSTVASTTFAAMPDTFSSTGFGQVVHVEEITGLANNTTYTYYVRCIDDEGNFNTDDYLITFNILDVPEGDPNTEGDVEGDGSGSGDSGDGGGSGGSSGGSSSGSNTSGSSGGGGSGGGGSGNGEGEEDDDEAGGGFESTDGPYPSGDARLIINGYAFPGSEIVILVDGQKATDEFADNSGKFSVTLDEIARGTYTFGIYAIDENGTKSTTFSTSFSVQGGKTSSLSNVNIMPSILVEPDPVDIGETVTISGFSIPDADVIIEHQNDATSASLKTFEAASDNDGEWSIEVDTTGFSQGTYKVRAKARQPDGLQLETDFSDYTYYGVGQEADAQLNADLNRDGNVNLIDFSILLFWWGSDGGTSDPPADINRDGNVSLTDFSILLFQWTG